jgi:molybdate transport system ATP-binding protein
MTALHIDVALRTGAFALEARLSVEPGVTVLFGPSGAGKSTVLALVSGLARPDRGRIALGDDVWVDREAGIERPVHQRKVAYVFQSLALFPHLTAAENTAYGMDRAVPRETRAARARELLARFHVGHLADRRPQTFSGGEAQRVALARAFAMAPRVVLMDEPFSALDHGLRKELLGVVTEIVKDLAVPTLFITHHVGEAETIAERVVLLDRGRIAGTGGTEILPERRSP